MHHTSIVLTWAPVASAAAAAIAAFASWRSVLQSRRLWLAGLLPDLAIQVTETVASGETQIHVVNAGNGLARNVQFFVIDGNEVAEGTVPPNGFLRGGQEVTLKTGFKPKPGGKSTAIVACEDREGRIHAWSGPSGHKSWRHRKWSRAKDEHWIYERFFPRVAYDSLTRVSIKLIEVGADRGR